MKFSLLGLLSGHNFPNNVALVVSAGKQMDVGRINREPHLREIQIAQVLAAIRDYAGIIRVLPGSGKASIIPDPKRKKKGGLPQLPQMVGIHTRRFDLMDSVRTRTQSFTVRVVALPKNDQPLKQRLARSAAEGGGPLLGAILNSLSAFYTREPGTVRTLQIWGPSFKQSGLGIGPKVLAGATHVLEPGEVERIRVEQILQALPDEPLYLPDFYQEAPTTCLLRTGVFFGSSYWRSRHGHHFFHAMFNMVLKNTIQLKALLSLPVDVTIQFENVEDREYGIYARAQAVVGANQLIDLDYFERALRLIVQKCDRVPRWDPFNPGLIDSVVRGLVGSPAELASPLVFSLGKDWDSFLKILGSTPTVEEHGDSGDVAVGLELSPNNIVQPTLTINTVEEAPVIGFIGVTHSGKTFKALEMMMQRVGSHWIFFHCSSTVDEYAGKLALALGGTYKRRELPDPENVNEYHEQVVVIEAEVNALIARFDALWTLADAPVKLPFVLHLSGNLALCTYYRLYAHQKLLGLVKKYFKERAWEIGWCADDAGSLPDPNVEDEHLGMITANTGRAYRHELKLMIQTYRKFGGFFAITVQTLKAFSAFGAGTFESLPLAILFPASKDHSVAALLRPDDYAKSKVSWSLEKAAAAILKGRKVKLPSGVLSIFNPFVPPEVRKLMGVK